MKKEMFGSILTLTAGLGATMVVPMEAFARESKAENKMPKVFKLKLNNKARYTDEAGVKHEGALFLSIEQEKWTPSNANLLHAEMIGWLYFESSDEKFYKDLGGEDGRVILDLIQAEDQERTYQIYSCSSTLNSCFGDKFQLTSAANGFSFSYELPENSPLEVKSVYSRKDENGNVVEEVSWIKADYRESMSVVK